MDRMALRRESLYLLGLTFFGLTSQYRLNLFNQIHEIVFHGKGGYDWVTVYNMPIWLRNFTFNKIYDFYEKENEKAKGETNKQTLIGEDGKVKTLEFAQKAKGVKYK